MAHTHIATCMSILESELVFCVFSPIPIAMYNLSLASSKIQVILADHSRTSDKHTSKINELGLTDAMRICCVKM